jgi:hypothetical protein
MLIATDTPERGSDRLMYPDSISFENAKAPDLPSATTRFLKVSALARQFLQSNVMFSDTFDEVVIVAL